MTIKDFSVGQPVCVLSFNKYMRQEPSYKETTVAKVGRKYVTTVYGDKQFEKHPNIDFALTEHVDWGYPSYLFASRKDAEEFVERCELAQWVSTATRGSCQYKYSLDQLRRVKAILTETRGCDPEVM